MSTPGTGVVAVGAGRMGRGIAHVFAFAGRPVTLVDLKHRCATEAGALLGQARDEIAANLSFLKDLGVLDEGHLERTMERIVGVGRGEADGALGQAEFVFEGVPEVIETKAAALGEIAAMAPDGAVIASTTSTMLVEALAEFVSRPEHFLNAHWLNPAYLIPLVEVSPGKRTDEAITARLMDLLEAVGKVPVRCKASPGYIVPRLQAVAMNEAARMVEEGVATAEEIDRAVRVGFGPRYATMGFLEFGDWGGIDILYYASRCLSGALGSERYAPAAIVERLMGEGKRGMREGQGFYDFRGQDVGEYQRDKLRRLVRLLEHMDLMPRLPGWGLAGDALPPRL